MSTGKALSKFTRSVSVNGAGELKVNAGRYSRAAVIMAFEMNGGIERFAEWVQENPDDFYTKMFSKLIGREVEQTSSVDIEGMLDVLDGESEDITDADIIEDDEDTEFTATEDVFTPTKHQLRMSRAALKYAEAEPLD